MKRRSLVGWLAAGIPLLSPDRGPDSPRLDRASDRDAINVRDYGAAGNGKRDDTAAIQSAIDASHGGKPVLIPAGRYRVRAPLAVHDDSVLLGNGRHSVLFCDDRDTDVLKCIGAKRVFLEGIALDGDGGNRDGLVVRQSDDVRVRRCWIKSMGGRGVTVENTPCTLTDTVVELCGADGVLVLETNSGEPLRVVSCSIFQNGGHGIHFTKNANQAIVTASDLIRNGGAGIRIDTASRMISIVGNDILGSKGSGIVLAGQSHSNSIVSNVIAESRLSAITIGPDADATILTANRFMDNCTAGVEGVAELVVLDSEDTVLMGNVFAHTTGTAQVPAIVADAASHIHSTANVFRGIAETPASPPP